MTDKQWKRKAIKALKKTIKKFKKPHNKRFNDIKECEFCKIYFSFWGAMWCLGCPLNIGDNIEQKWGCLEFECYEKFVVSLEHGMPFPNGMRCLSSKQKKLAERCVKVMEKILIRLEELPEYRFNPLTGMGFPELDKWRRK